MPYHILTLFLLLVLLMSSSIHAEDNTHLVVAWLANNDLMVWHTGDSEPTHHAVPDNIATNARQLLISSDGQYVAVNVAYPGSLWFVTPTDSDLIEVVPNEALPTTDDPKFMHIGNLQRGANNTFYFNTYDQPSHYTLQHNDLWLVDAASHTIKLLLPSPQGGLFNPSPDSQHVAIIQSGTYGTVDGVISLVDKDGQNRQDVMTFSAVSSGSDNEFDLQSFWEADSASFNVAIPHKDLIYHDDSALTSLWHIGVDGTKIQRGTVQATFFGLPQWSYDGAYIAYLRHKGDITSNQFELMIASGDGSHPVTYANGTAGRIGIPQWLPNSGQFIYEQGEPGDYWLGQSGQPPQALPEKIFNPHFVDSTTYIFATTNGNTFELRYAHIGDASSTLIASMNAGNPIFDALQVP